MRHGLAKPLLQLLWSTGSASSQSKASSLCTLQGPVITILQCMSGHVGWLAPFGFPWRPSGISESVLRLSDPAAGWLGFTLRKAFDWALVPGRGWDSFWLTLPGGRILLLPVRSDRNSDFANEPRMERICHVMGKCISMAVLSSSAWVEVAR